MSRGLKGSNFARNIINAMVRINRLGYSKSDSEMENLTFSLKIQQVRQSLLNDFKNYLERNGLTDKKLNHYMNNEITTDFLKNRTEHLSVKSAETLIRSFGSLLSGLKNTGVSILLEKEVINTMVKDLKEDFKPIPASEISKSFANVENVVEKMFEKSFEYGVLSSIFKETGLRWKEGLALLQHPNKFLSNNTVHSISGKGGFIIKDKVISQKLVEQIHQVKNTNINHKSFNNALKSIEVNKSAHSFRFSYIQQQMQIKLNDGLSYKDMKLQLSLEISHKRPSITQYYINRI